MTTELVIALSGVMLAEANNLVRDSKKGKLPIVDSSFRLVSLFARPDLLKTQNFLLSSKRPDSEQLYAAAAVGTRSADREHLRVLKEARIDVIILYSRQDNSIYQIEMIKWIKKQWPDLEVVAGNVVTREQAAILIHAGADALRVGMGSGLICITQEVLAVGRPQSMLSIKKQSSHPSLAFTSLRTEESPTSDTSSRPWPWAWVPVLS